MMNFLRLIALAALLASSAGHAQLREPFEAEPAGPLLRGDVAGSRQPVGLEPTGVHAGPLLVQPSLTTRIEADSNVLNRSSGKRGDVYVVFAPAVKVSGESGSASYALRADAAVARFASETSQDRETFGVEANARLALAKKAAVFARASYDRKVEPPASAGESAVEGSPAEYDELEGQLALRVEAADIRVTASVTATRRIYADIAVTGGGIADQSFRDARSLRLVMKAEYAIPAGATLFAQGSYNWNESINQAALADRSAQGGQFLGGVRADLSNLMSLEAAAGYVFLDYDEAVFEDFDGLAWRAKLEWYPTPLLSLSLSGGRTIVNSGLIDVPGIVVDSASLQLFYELRRNFTLVATLTRTNEDYREADTTAHSTLYGIEGRYILNPRYTTGIYGRLRSRESSGLLRPRGGGGIEGGMWLRVSI